MNAPKPGRHLRIAAISAAALAALVLSTPGAAPGAAGGPTTLDRTILDIDGDGRFEYAAGEPVTVREELGAQALPGRESRRRKLLSFIGMTDFQLVDEETPLHAEIFEACGNVPTKSALRPSEAMTNHVVNSNVRAANAMGVGPITREEFDFAIQLGDAVESPGRNEIRWVIDILDGYSISGRLIDPDSGADGYEGTQSVEPWPRVDGTSILELANEPYYAPGLRRPDGSALPWYSVMGNHDAKAQGTAPNLPGWVDFTRVLATGPIIFSTIAPYELPYICADPSILTDPAFIAQVLARPGTARLVTPDALRFPVTRNMWKAEHLPPAEAVALDPDARGSDGVPFGHGFKEPPCTDADGGPLPRLCYSFDAQGIHFVVLDTNPDEGLAGGNLDLRQMAWLERDLAAHSAQYYAADGTLRSNPAGDNRLIVVFSHHTSETMNEEFPVNLTTLDEREDGFIDADGRAFGPDFVAMLHRFPNVILHGAGHTHRNRVWALPGRPADPVNGLPATGYWEVNSSSHADWPNQSRTIEITDNGDGTLSIFGVVFDASAPPRACHGDETDACLQWSQDDTHESDFDPSLHDVNEEFLAAVARQVAYADPQGPRFTGEEPRGRHDDGTPHASEDRNVELVIGNPLATVGPSFRTGRRVGGARFVGPVPAIGSGLGGGLAVDPPGTPTSAFTRQVPRGFGTERGVGDPATAGAIPDWAVAAASLLLAASAALYWMSRTRVRAWMLGAPR